MHLPDVKAYGRSEGIVPLIPNPSNRCRCVVNFATRPIYRRGEKKTPVPTENEAGCTPEMVWSFQIRGKSLAHAGIGTADDPNRDLVSV